MGRVNDRAFTISDFLSNTNLVNERHRWKDIVICLTWKQILKLLVKSTKLWVIDLLSCQKNMPFYRLLFYFRKTCIEKCFTKKPALKKYIMFEEEVKS